MRTLSFTGSTSVLSERIFSKMHVNMQQIELKIECKLFVFKLVVGIKIS